jgi:tryptophan-rich sensory protein
MNTLAKPPRFSWQPVLLAAGGVTLAAGIGSFATIPNIPGWYAGLDKPSFTPPNWAFGPAWTVLYVLMGISFWRILNTANGSPGRRTAIGVFIVQLTLNALWSVAFFGLHSPLFGLVVIFAMIAAIVATIFAFWPLDRIAGLLMLPYLAWVAFASALNLSVFLLNR